MMAGDARKKYFQTLKPENLDFASLIANTQDWFQSEDRTHVLPGNEKI